MKEIDIRSKCRVNSNYEGDTFVGLKCENGDISINFPIGFHLSEDDVELRKDILLLFATIADNTEKRESGILGQVSRFEEVEFPLQSYIYILKDFFDRGYYKEQEFLHKPAKKGRVDWNRTIKSQRPYIQNSNIYYLDFIVKKNNIKENEIITLIHEYCVYQSFKLLGWLFTSILPKKPQIVKKDNIFIALLKNKISHTFNDRNIRLFRHMLAIINFEGEKNSDMDYKYGTYRFEYIWEKMIDKVFGIENKTDYFPKTVWLLNGRVYTNAALEPDTIMICENNVYILDAKYYKYGVTKNVRDLPGSVSINKQITYGEYVANAEEIKKQLGNNMKVYNAFLMPFDTWIKHYPDHPEMLKVGEAASNWKDGSKEYHRIQAILVDIKTLMSINVRHEQRKIEQLAELIEF